MRQIEVTEAQHDLLARLSHELRTQKNYGTENPIYCVYRRAKVYNVDPRYSDQIEWRSTMPAISFDDGSPEMNRYISEFRAKCLKDDVLAISPERILYFAGFEPIHYKTINVFVQAFFSEKAANEFIEVNKGKMDSPYVYVDSAYKNIEIQVLREVIMSVPDIS